MNSAHQPSRDAGWITATALTVITLTIMALPVSLMMIDGILGAASRPPEPLNPHQIEWSEGSAHLAEIASRADDLRICADPPRISLRSECSRVLSIGVHLVPPPTAMPQAYKFETRRLSDANHELIACLPVIETDDRLSVARRSRWCLLAVSADGTDPRLLDQRVMVADAYKVLDEGSFTASDGEPRSGVKWRDTMIALGMSVSDSSADKKNHAALWPQLFPDMKPEDYLGDIDPTDRVDLILFWAGDDDACDTNNDGIGNTTDDPLRSPECDTELNDNKTDVIDSGYLLPQYEAEYNASGDLVFSETEWHTDRGGVAPPPVVIATDIEWWCMRWAAGDDFVDPCPSAHDPQERYVRTTEDDTPQEKYQKLHDTAIALQSIPTTLDEILASRRTTSTGTRIPGTPVNSIHQDAAPIIRDWLRDSTDCATFLGWGNPAVAAYRDTNGDVKGGANTDPAPNPSSMGDGFLPVWEAAPSYEHLPAGILPQHLNLAEHPPTTSTTIPGSPTTTPDPGSECVPQLNTISQQLTTLEIVVCKRRTLNERLDYSGLFEGNTFVFDVNNPDWGMWPRHCDLLPAMIVTL